MLKVFSLNRVISNSFIGLLLGLSQSAFAETTPFWLPPFFMQVPWKTNMVRVQGEDTTVFVSKDTSGNRLVADYGDAHYLQEMQYPLIQLADVDCSLEKTASRQAVAVCKLTGVTNKAIMLTLTGSSTPEKMLLNLVNSMRHVGKVTRIKVMSVNVKGKHSSAVITDESNIARTVRLGDRVMDHLGTVKKISTSGIEVHQYIYDTDPTGGEEKVTKLVLSK